MQHLGQASWASDGTDESCPLTHTVPKKLPPDDLRFQWETLKQWFYLHGHGKGKACSARTYKASPERKTDKLDDSKMKSFGQQETPLAE